MLIIHGEDAKKSSDFLSSSIDSARNSGDKIFSFDSKDLDITKLTQILDSAGLFGDTPTVLISNLLTATKSKAKDILIKYLTEKQQSKITLFEQKQIPAASLKPFLKSEIKLFNIDKNIFKFTEKIIPRNQSILLPAFRKLLDQGEDLMYLEVMIMRQIKLLLQVKTHPQLIKLPPYPKKMLQDQATRFTLDKLLDCHHRLYQIDTGLKTGTSPVDMENQLMNFLSNL